MVMVTYYNVYYCVIVAWSLYYFVASFVAIPNLPWDTCGKYEQMQHNSLYPKHSALIAHMGVGQNPTHMHP